MNIRQEVGDERYDLVVVGAGLAGMVAGIRATELGLRVLVLEAGNGAAYPCNSRFTMGFFHIAFNDVTADPHYLHQVIVEATGGDVKTEMAHCIADNIGRGIRWLGANGGKFIKAGPLPWMSRVLAPPRVRRTGVHWEGRGGDVLLRNLAKRLVIAGGKLVTGARVRSLNMHDGRCIGVRLHSVDDELLIRAEGVVLADGGFQANPDLVREFISPSPERLCMRNAGSGVGNGLDMARKIGAGSTGLNRFYGHVQCLEALKCQKLWPYPVLDNLSIAGVVVDKNGCRFTDEGLGGIYTANAIATLDEPDSAIVIFDDAIWNGVGRQSLLAPNPGAVAAGARLYSSDSVEDLAEQLGLSKVSLINTILHHNKIVSKRDWPISPPRTFQFGPPQMIQKKPFHAFRACAGITYTMGGISIDNQARVLDTCGALIPGLYAAGATTGGLEGGGAAAYIGGLSKSLVLGLVAAETAVNSIKAGKNKTF